MKPGPELGAVGDRADQDQVDQDQVDQDQVDQDWVDQDRVDQDQVDQDWVENGADRDRVENGADRDRVENGADRDPPLLTVGVIADTHIPDRVRALHPCILPRLREAKVAHILHAGDISTARVLEELRQAAPVTAVRGNRDLLAGPLAMIERLNFGGVPVALMHGHGGWLPYLWDKWQFWLFGYRLERYQERLVQDALPAKVAVFGHTHHRVLKQYKGVLLFNPGSASFGAYRRQPPSMGLLHIYPGGRFAGQILPLEGYKIKKRQWVRLS